MPKQTRNKPFMIVNLIHRPVSKATQQKEWDSNLPGDLPGAEAVKAKTEDVASVKEVNGQPKKLIERHEFVEFKDRVSNADMTKAAFVLNLENNEVLKNRMPGFHERLKAFAHDPTQTEEILTKVVIRYFLTKWKDKVKEALIAFYSKHGIPGEANAE